MKKWYLCWLCLSLAALILPLYQLRGAVLPLWPALPICGTFFYYHIVRWQDSDPPSHTLSAASWATFSLAVYPLFSLVTSTAFY